MVKEANDEFEKLSRSPREFVEGILAKYVATLPLDDLNASGKAKGDLKIIEVAIADLQEIGRRARRGQDAIYARCGVCPEWQASEHLSHSIHVVIACLEDILCLAMQGVSALAEADFLGELMYMQELFH